MSKICPKCGNSNSQDLYNGFRHCRECCTIFPEELKCPSCQQKDEEIDSLKVELYNLRHFCDSILEKAKRNNGVLYFRQDSGTWKIETGKDNDVPANPTDNDVGSMEVTE